MRLSIITPSFRGDRWLRFCVASIADQSVSHEHIIQDAGSDDGTLDWLTCDPRVLAFIEKDQGMYDAINRGFRRSRGEILAWLNCDEQYLPGVFSSVLEFFDDHPEVDVLFGDVVFVNSDGGYECHRKMQVPLLYHTWTCHLSTLSCATFFRRRVFFDLGFEFDPGLRDSGDGEWMVRLLRSGLKMAALGEFTSVFTRTGANMSAGLNARREAHELHRTAPWWARLLKPGWILHHRWRRLLGGMYTQPAFSYQIYTPSSPGQRQKHHVSSPVFHRG